MSAHRCRAGTGSAADGHGIVGGSNAASVTRNPFRATFLNPCDGGELVTVSGTLVVVVRSSVTPTGGTHLTVVSAWQNVTGTSASGTNYRVMHPGTASQQFPLPAEG